MILSEKIKQQCALEPDRDVLTFVNVENDGELSNEVRTYQQLWDNAQKCAQLLQRSGLKKGDAFAIIMANHPEFVELMIASSILGTIFVPIDPRTKGQKLAFMLEHADCKAAIVENSALEEVNKAWPATGSRWVLPLQSDLGYTSCLQHDIKNTQHQTELPCAVNDIDAPMQLLYTSGTTGDPKAIMSSYRRFSDISQLAPVLGLDRNDRPYTGLSLTHANAQIVSLGNMLYHSMRGVISRRFTKSRLWDIARKFDISFFNLLGGMTNAVYAEPGKANDNDNPVKRILVAGMPSDIWHSFAQRFDVELFEFYGAAEGGLTFNPPGQGPIGSCGKPGPSQQLKILDDNDLECAPHESGEICFRNADGSPIKVDYFKNPEASKAKTSGGWLRMGDVGYVDDEGWLFFQYRKGGGIRKNGDFINTASIEKVFMNMPIIDDVYVYGVATSDNAPGEKQVVAAIVLSDESTFNTDNVRLRCQQHLDKNAIPSHIQILEAIPKTASEKPIERLLLIAFEENINQIIHL